MNRRRRAIVVTVAAVLTAVTAGDALPSTTGASSPITVVGWQPGRGGSEVWDGGPTHVKAVRFLRGAQLATVSPSGASLAYIRYAGNGFDLFHTGVYSGFQARLAHVAGSRTTTLAFSPDSRTVAFASPRGIELTSIVPGRGRKLVPLPGRWRGSTYQGLRFSPDGRLLAFSRTWGNGRAGTLRNELDVVGLNGTGARALARNPDPFNAQYRPSFSPDGTRIAFATADGGLAWVPTSGGAVVRLTSATPTGSSRSDADPLFSPDGTTVAFTRSPGRGGSDVYLVDADGSGLRRLTITPLPVDPGAARTGSTALAWSPDGTEVLAFRRDRLAAVDAATGASATLAVIGLQYTLSDALWH